MLVLLALKQGRFKDFKPWTELMTCTANGYGSPILLKQSCLRTSVFMQTSIGIEALETQRHLWTSFSLREVNDNLSRLAGRGRWNHFSLVFFYGYISLRMKIKFWFICLFLAFRINTSQAIAINSSWGQWPPKNARLICLESDSRSL